MRIVLTKDRQVLTVAGTLRQYEELRELMKAYGVRVQPDSPSKALAAPVNHERQRGGQIA